MHYHALTSLALVSLAVASPTPSPQGVGQGADSCASDALTPDTWKTLKVDDFLIEASKNYTRTPTNNVQSLAASFGAPNFFCGLDKFCNAGQPCLPIQLPAWYAALAIQNWNNYMNSLNTAITFASSILSLQLGSIVNDVYPDPRDDVTPLKNIGSIFGAVLGVVPFTGQVASAVGLANSGLSFVLGRVQPPQPADKFLAWSNLGASMADIVSEYQNTVSNSIDTILDAEIDDPKSGINAILTGGQFLGVSENFTQSDLQATVIDSITTHAIGMALQAQKIFVTRFFNRADCNRDTRNNEICRQNEGSETFTVWMMLRSDSDENADPQFDIADKLVEKYGFTPEQMTKGVTDCYDANDKKQLTNVFDAGGLPADAKAPCVFNLLVCDIDIAAGPNDGIVPTCKGQGLDI